MSILDKLNNILDTKQKITENTSNVESFQTNYDKIIQGEALENLEHNHRFTIDSYGNGRTSVDDGHYHMLEYFEILPSDLDGHYHMIKLDSNIEAKTSVGYCFVNMNTSVPPKLHSHIVSIDPYGNGKTNNILGHFHKVMNFRMLPVEDNHSHFNFELD